MEYAATIQTLGQAQFNLGLSFARIKERTEKNAERMLQGLVLAILISVPFFQSGIFFGEAIVRTIGHLSYVQETAAHLGAFYSFALIPAVLYVGWKKSTGTILKCAALASSVMGTLFYLSLC